MKNDDRSRMRCGDGNAEASGSGVVGSQTIVGNSDQNALSKLLQMGTMAEYQNLNRLYNALLRSNPTTLGEAFSLARATEARFTDLQLWKLLSNNNGLQNQNLTTPRFTMPRQEPIDEAVFVKMNDETKGFSLAESIEENNAFDATLSDQPTAGLEANKVVNNDDGEVLVDGKQDDAKVVGVADEQNSDEPNVLEGNGVIVVGVNKNNKGFDKEVQYSVYTQYLILFLKRLNDKYIKKEKIEAEIQRRI
nr:AIG1-like protein [Tanacetum cinerariifolium]